MIEHTNGGFAITVDGKRLEISRDQAAQLVNELADLYIYAPCPTQARCDLSYNASIDLMIQRDDLLKRLKETDR